MKYQLLIVLICCFSFRSEGQFYKYFDLEAAVNGSLIVNKGEFVSEEIWNGNTKIENQQSAIFLNYRLALGIKLHPRHRICFSYGSNNIGAKITGEVTTGGGFSNGPFQNNRYINFTNKLHAFYWGVGYEYAHQIKKHQLLLAVAFNRHQSSYEDVFVPFEGLGLTNYSYRGSIGYSRILHQYISVITRAVVTNHLAARGQLCPPYTSEFVPVQYGIEVGLRFHFVQ